MDKVINALESEKMARTMAQQELHYKEQELNEKAIYQKTLRDTEMRIRDDELNRFEQTRSAINIERERLDQTRRIDNERRIAQLVREREEELKNYNENLRQTLNREYTMKLADEQQNILDANALKMSSPLRWKNTMEEERYEQHQ